MSAISYQLSIGALPQCLCQRLFPYIPLGIICVSISSKANLHQAPILSSQQREHDCLGRFGRPRSRPTFGSLPFTCSKSTYSTEYTISATATSRRCTGHPHAFFFPGCCKKYWYHRPARCIWSDLCSPGVFPQPMTSDDVTLIAHKNFISNIAVPSTSTALQT